jgi:hypothetical protein
VLGVVAGDDALAAVVDLVASGVPVLDDLQAAVDLAAQLGVGEVAAGDDGPLGRHRRPRYGNASGCEVTRRAPRSGALAREAEGQPPSRVMPHTSAVIHFRRVDALQTAFLVRV